MSEQTVTEAINDTLKAIAVSLLMEQVLAPRFNFKSKILEADPKKDLIMERMDMKMEN